MHENHILCRKAQTKNFKWGNKMTFWGNIVYLRPRSIICGPSAKRKGRKWHYKGKNKQYAQEKSFYYHYYLYTKPNDTPVNKELNNIFDNTSTVELRFNEPLFKENFDITISILCSSYSKIYEKEPRYNEPSIKRTNLAGPQRLCNIEVPLYHTLHWKF